MGTLTWLLGKKSKMHLTNIETKWDIEIIAFMVIWLQVWSKPSPKNEVGLPFFTTVIFTSMDIIVVNISVKYSVNFK